MSLTSSVCGVAVGAAAALYLRSPGKAAREELHLLEVVDSPKASPDFGASVVMALVLTILCIGLVVVIWLICWCCFCRSAEEDHPHAVKKISEPPVLDLLDIRVKYIEHSYAHRSASLLLVGGICMILSFLSSGGISMYDFAKSDLQVNFRGEPMASGQNYHEMSVSDMAHDPSTPQGKCFFAFNLLAALFILVSWYPFYLANCFIGDESNFFGVPGPMPRTFLPPVGAVLTIAVTMTPIKQATAAEWVSTGIHGFGASLMMLGYIWFEVHALAYSKVVRFSGKREKLVRWSCVIFCSVSMVIWVCSTGVAINGELFGICCDDVWAVPSLDDIRAAQQANKQYSALKAMEGNELGKPMLLNTASSSVLAFKLLAFWFEGFTGLSLAVGLIAIWWYAPESVVNLSSEEFKLLRKE